MLRSRLLMAVALLALSACGESDSKSPEEPGYVEPPDDNQPDHRPNVTGTYDVTGTLGTELNGRTDFTPIRDVVRIDATHSVRSRVHVHLNDMNCGTGILATMTSETTFTINEGSCPLPPESGCTSTVRFNAGSGSRPVNGALQLGLQGQLEVRCGSQSASARLSLDVSGSHTGQDLPDTQAQVLARRSDLASALRRREEDVRP